MVPGPAPMRCTYAPTLGLTPQGAGHLHSAQCFYSRNQLDDSFYVQFVMGILGGIAATIPHLLHMKQTAESLFGDRCRFATIAAGRFAGGPAKVSVVSSGLFGMISGSAIANTVTTGVMTIPLMKKVGFQPRFAGAVEASASCGGQITPPIMGAAAFIMAEFLNVPYLDIAKAAAIPACLYFFGVFMEVHFEAKRCNLRGLSRDELPKFGNVMRERGHLFVPLFAIILFLSVGFTPLYAALMGLVTCIIAGALKKATRMSFRQIADGFELGARNAIGVGLACPLPSSGLKPRSVTLTC